MTEAELRELGFTQAGDRILYAPADSDTTLVPIGDGDFYELRIRLGRSGISVVTVVSKIAIKRDQRR